MKKATTPDPSQIDRPASSRTLHRSSRISHPPERYGFTHASLMTKLSSISIPRSYSLAVQHDCWK